MKKIFVMLAAAACSLAAMATDYTGKLTVNVNDVVSEMETTISVDESAGVCNFDLKNFVLVAEDGNKMGVGNISLHNLAGNTAYGFTNIKFNDKVVITEGDLEEVDFWMGPILGEVPVVLNADFNAQALSVNIDIDMMDTLEQVIKVNFVGTAPAVPGLKGDVNGDGTVDVSDVTTVINVMLGGK
ncbi:MAG: dockerin type I domain-containing protein [Muribaculaceae bacterium]|nr:dockerin type I domain-containing protein [Muribaculaceae bacterium]